MQALKRKNHRLNRIKSILINTNIESALSISEIHIILLKDHFKVDRKTISRDVQELSLSTYLQETDTHPKRFYIEDSSTVDYMIDLKENELQFILFALGNLKAMSSSTIQKICLDAEVSLLNRLPKKLRETFKGVQDTSFSGNTILGKADDIEPHVLNLVLKSLKERKFFTCHYNSPYSSSLNSKKERTFGPLKIYFIGGAPYLFVIDFYDDFKIKNVRLSRVSKVNGTEIPVNTNKAKDIDMTHALGGYGSGKEKIINYKITCTQELATYFQEHIIHESQRIKTLRNGNYQVTFSMNTNYAVVRHLSQFAESMINIQPKFVLEEIKKIWRHGLNI